MNWYNQLKIAEKEFYDEEDLEQNINVLLEKDYQDKNYPINIKKIELFEKIKNLLSFFPPGFKIKKEIDGWSVLTPDEKIITFDEKTLPLAIQGAKVRFDFLGQSL